MSLVENRVVTAPDDTGAIYHSIDTMDYVSVLAVTADGRIPMVRQFRPAVRRFTLEFPGGLRDGDEAPETCAIRELAEEVGLAASRMRPLATMIPDSGRLGNRMWTFFAPDVVPIPDWRPEVERRAQDGEPSPSCCALALDGSFDHAPHVAMLGMAVMRGWLAAAVMRQPRASAGSRQPRCQKSACSSAASSSSSGPITSVARCPAVNTMRHGRSRVGFSACSPVIALRPFSLWP